MAVVDAVFAPHFLTNIFILLSVDAVFAPHFLTNIFILLSVDAVFAPHFLTNFFILLSALPAFYSQSAFYPWSAVCSLQSAVGVLH